ncbi:coiled-coil domain-containing protein 137 isoform X2 [Spodoptera frugiperda]|uniref:Coiled-coil domain-containing protein 137 isoform X2 n=1 Tax=Spodoptera frugiperda TaxID=7108 RepID=A0A9R0CY33_SPOFR|nr:coiled-coil domain-containing protein 137 isoform X2 [Spodoptera frugiperda]
MGRKIPAKKHRGVKDPLVQQARRLEGLKGKINAPPKDPDEQPVPKSLTRLFAFQEKKTEKNITKKNKINNQIKNNKGGRASGASPNPVSRLRKLPGESGREFSLRINSAVKALHNPVEDLHYPRDFEAEDEKGLQMSEYRERRARKRRKAALASRGAPSPAAEPRLSRTQKLALKKKAKKSKAIQAGSERREVEYERVSFGEVSHAPPALHFKAAGAPRPGRRQLLLSSLLGPGAPAAGAQAAAGARAPADAERARLQAVAAYRALKANKHKNK